MEKAKLIELARNSIESVYTKSHIDLENYSFNDKLGVFVTLYIDGNLRGCIGYPRPYYSLREGIYQAARAAAFEDSRFEPLSEEDFAKVKIEISVLSSPQLIEVERYHDYIDKIDLGTDGLILEHGNFSGLLLSQVPIEWGWDTIEFLENLCYKAGLSKDDWKEVGVKIYKFQSVVYKED
ncbi:hypothetical protein BVX95_00580 [archaeon D22]|nr:hypothetical protein BVX95_00580 [archaeon D22]